MKEALKIDMSYEDMKELYFQNHGYWKIERMLLESYLKEELERLIEVTGKSYRGEGIIYKHGLMRKKFRSGYGELNEIGRYFIEAFAYEFEGGKELELTEKFLKKLNGYYREKYEISPAYKNRNPFDISSISIEEIISRYVSLPKNLKRNIRCPLHADKTASFRVYPQTQSFYCFGCHKGGNAVNFVAEIEDISSKEAYKKLAQIYSNTNNYGL